ncbi:MAG: ABC transporter ATP-binding protein, partial [Caldilineaceae bacterium]|nr:ABC transporter ATP-binding protein [Caldilineaceae bacterium]
MFRRPTRPERGKGAPRPSMKELGRAMRYLGLYKRTTALAYISLFISLGAQLVVPQLVQNVIDAVTQGLIAQQTGQLPAQAQAMIADGLGITAERLTQIAANPEAPIYWALGFILVFSVARGFFAFAQTFMGQKVSQDLAFEFRNELFAKIQRLS